MIVCVVFVGETQTNVNYLATVVSIIIPQSRPSLRLKKIGQIRGFHIGGIRKGFAFVRLSRSRVEPPPLHVAGNELPIPGTVTVRAREENFVDITFIQPRFVGRRVESPHGERRPYRRVFHDGSQVAHYFLRSVPVMNVEIDDRDLLDAVVPVHAPRVRRADGDVVQEAKSVGAVGIVGAGDDPPRTGVVSGRTDGAEGVPRVARHDFVDGLAHAAGGPQGGFEAPARYGGVGVESLDGPGMIGGGRAELAGSFDVGIFVYFQDIREGRPSHVGVPFAAAELPASQNSIVVIDEDIEPSDIFRGRFGRFHVPSYDGRTGPMLNAQLVAENEGASIRIHNEISRGILQPQNLQIVRNDHPPLPGHFPRGHAAFVECVRRRSRVDQQPRHVPIPARSRHVEGSPPVIIPNVDLYPVRRQQQFRDAGPRPSPSPRPSSPRVVALGRGVEGPAARPVRPQIERFLREGIVEQHSHHRDEVRNAGQIEGSVKGIVSHGRVGPVFHEEIDAFLGEFRMQRDSPDADGEVDGSAAIALFMRGGARFEEETDVVDFSGVDGDVERSVVVVVAFVEIVGTVDLHFFHGVRECFPVVVGRWNRGIFLQWGREFHDEFLIIRLVRSLRAYPFQTIFRVVKVHGRIIFRWVVHPIINTIIFNMHLMHILLIIRLGGQLIQGIIIRSCCFQFQRTYCAPHPRIIGTTIMTIMTIMTLHIPCTTGFIIIDWWWS
mmetsp:Transcript_39957/g.86131  ORF Transcript_39957/g.86131 Transcript_39957/m.86131 type:complete len:720 (+) Transcript_39957:711-2870(+)